MAEAARWYGRAARLGSVRGMNQYARCLFYGLGTERDEAAGLRWYEKAAATGDPTAVTDFGLALERRDPPDCGRAAAALPPGRGAGRRPRAVLPGPQLFSGRMRTGR